MVNNFGAFHICPFKTYTDGSCLKLPILTKYSGFSAVPNQVNSKLLTDALHQQISYNVGDHGNSLVAHAETFSGNRHAGGSDGADRDRMRPVAPSFEASE